MLLNNKLSIYRVKLPLSKSTSQSVSSDDNAEIGDASALERHDAALSEARKNGIPFLIIETQCHRGYVGVETRKDQMPARSINLGFRGVGTQSPRGLR